MVCSYVNNESVRCCYNLRGETNVDVVATEMRTNFLNTNGKNAPFSGFAIFEQMAYECDGLTTSCVWRQKPDGGWWDGFRVSPRGLDRARGGWHPSMQNHCCLEEAGLRRREEFCTRL